MKCAYLGDPNMCKFLRDKGADDTYTNIVSIEINILVWTNSRADSECSFR